MGIQGLLPALKSIITPVHVRSYAGKRAAIDTYAWLHRAAYSCSKEVCEGRPTEKFIDYCMHRINLLRHYGIQPVMVFDGGVLPMKADQEEKRARSRKDHLERAKDHERLGNSSASYECYQKAVDITPAMASRLIEVLKNEGIQYIVAPYEADAQMAFLAFQEYVDVIITEDSDLIAYGCSRKRLHLTLFLSWNVDGHEVHDVNLEILFKMDKFGQGEEYQYGDLYRNKDLDFRNFTKQMVLEMCVMTGCDYLPSLPGMGVKKAHGLIKRFKTYKKVIRHLRFGGTNISSEYEERFQRALLTFHYQRVYDPISHRMVHLTDVPDDVTVDLEFVGPDLPQELVKSIAVGDVDPSTNLPFQKPRTGKDTALPKSSTTSYQFVAKKSLEMSPQKNVLTNYFYCESEEVKKQFKTPRMVFCAEKQSKDRPCRQSGSVVSGTGDVASTPEAEIFGTPLPDDSFEDGLSGVNESKVPGFEPQARNRRSEILQATSADLCATFSGKDRKKSIVDGSQIKRSGYFSPHQPMREESSDPHDGDYLSVIETELKHVENGGIEVTKKSRIDLREVDFEKPEMAGSSEEGSQPPGRFGKFIHTISKRNVSLSSCTLENRDPLSCSLVPRQSGSFEVGTFCTNVSHVAQFASIAQTSVDKFAATIGSFRWSSKGGARASGLRAPLATISANTKRLATTGHLHKFAYQASTFKPPSRKTSVTNGVVRSKENESPP